VRGLVGASDSGRTGEGPVNLIGFIINRVFGAVGKSWREKKSYFGWVSVLEHGIFC
jgi:hypothetical protein